METYTAPFGEVLTAIATPFNASGEVDYGQFWKLCRHLVDNGNDGLVVTGTTGESPTLRIAEKIALYRTAIDAVGQKAHVIAGTGTYDTRESVELTRRATDLGCTGIMAVTPYYSKPPQEGLFRHFTAIANASTVPVLLYNIPGRTSRLIDNDTLERLSKHDSIVAVKDAVEDIAFTNETVDRCGGDLVVYSGSDHMTLPIIQAGGVGVVSVAGHVAGNQIKAMVTAARAGDDAEATRLHDGLMGLFTALFVEPNPMPLKAALNAFWDKVGGLRLPLIEASEATMQSIEKEMAVVQEL